MKGKKLRAAGLICLKSYLALINCIQNRLLLHRGMVIFPLRPEFMWNQWSINAYILHLDELTLGVYWPPWVSAGRNVMANLIADVTFFLIPLIATNEILTPCCRGVQSPLQSCLSISMLYCTGAPRAFSREITICPRKGSITQLSSLFSSKMVPFSNRH